MEPCTHRNIQCLNQFEYIRKYQCKSCAEVMMCSCDEIIGRRFLPHQLAVARELRTQVRVEVTIGFQPKVCSECRGLPPVPHPVAATPRRTSKIKRFYWREIAFRKFELFAAWAEANGLDPNRASGPDVVAAHKQAEALAIEEIKAFHARSPKYDMREESSEDVLRRHNVHILELHAPLTRAQGGSDRIQVQTGSGLVSVEDFVREYYETLRYQVLRLESRPFHVLFGIYMYLVIQDASDPHLEMCGFGSRTAYDEGKQREPIWTLLPPDFGTPGYFDRRRAQIDAHLSAVG